MNIVFAASEAAPFVKTGGLGDVARALPFTLSSDLKQNVTLVLPFYRSIRQNETVKTEEIARFSTLLGWRNQETAVFRVKSRKKKLSVLLIDCPAYFDRERPYGYPDDGERFAFFSKAVLETLVRLDIRADIIHCNDWQTALIPTLLHAFYAKTLPGVKTVFTIHNIEYQGWVHPYFLGDVLGLDGSYNDLFQIGDGHNFLKSAILSSDSVTTVSRTYAKEILEPYYAHGLDGVIRENARKLSGIVNGIDTEENDPMRDPNLAVPYGVLDYAAGKKACKEALQKEVGLPLKKDAPLIGMVSRLVAHKGLDLLCEALDEILQKDVQIVILGTGEKEFENRLTNFACRYAGRFALCLRFSGALASRIYAGSDLYLMPSKSEPCGLSQLIAERYGSLPVVHETGGLKDTVEPFDPTTGKGCGFTFYDFNRQELVGAVDRAVTLYREKPLLFAQAVKNAMTADLSWKKSAAEYLSLYESLL